MKRRRHTPEQIVRKLREADRMLAEGTELPEVAKALEVSEATFHRWRNQFGGMKADDVKRLKELERENHTLKRIVAEKEPGRTRALRNSHRRKRYPRDPAPTLLRSCERGVPRSLDSAGGNGAGVTGAPRP